ncbi:hypothetical protein BaRGS_00029936 [Batillaria attramentaria]|uniref:Uncharacterized protein n=1 Tax=Batillaria attramentaria TaxID=370345 RepID=A0ABD0JUR0_9CAEN
MWTSSRDDTTESSTDLAALQTRRYNRIVHRPGCSTDSKLLVMWTSSRDDTTESSTDLAALQTVNCLSCGLLPETIQPNRPQTWLLYRQ